MSKHKSISQRLRKKLPVHVKQQIVNDWIDKKKTEFDNAVQALDDAINRNDIYEMRIALDTLKHNSTKSFDAMPNIAKALLDTPHDGDYN